MYRVGTNKALKKEKNMENYIIEFLEYCRVEKNFSPNTIIAYKYHLTTVDSWLNEHSIYSLEQLKIEHIKQFRSELAESGKKKSTQFYILVALRSFLHFLARQNIQTIRAEQIELGKVSDRQIKYLTAPQVEKLMLVPNLSSLVGIRDRAILEVLFSTGLRIRELASVKLSQIDFLNKSFTIIGKGGRARLIFLSDEAIKYIKMYQSQRNDSDSDNLFDISVRHIQRRLEIYGKKLNLPFNLSPHVLRHSFGTDLLINGADIRSVQEMLGHRNLNTTQLYTHITDKQLQDTYAKFHRRRGV